jgi:hypothetical protein
MRLRRMQHSGTHCVAFFGTRGRQGIRHSRSIYDRRLEAMWFLMTNKRFPKNVRQQVNCNSCK